jgi:hypothetical protein
MRDSDQHLMRDMPTASCDPMMLEPTAPGSPLRYLTDFKGFAHPGPVPAHLPPSCQPQGLERWGQFLSCYFISHRVLRGQAKT